MLLSMSRMNNLQSIVPVYLTIGQSTSAIDFLEFSLLVFEPTKNPVLSLSKDEALVGVSGTTPTKKQLESLEPRNNFRTSANPRPMSRFRETGAKSAHLLATPV